MKKWAGLLVWMVSLSANATLPSDLEAGAVCDSQNGCVDYYAELEKLFAQGTIPAVSEVTGWYSGRCFYDYDHLMAKAGLLVGFTESGMSDNGPLFPNKDILKYLVLHYNGGPANVYDKLTPALEADVVNVLNANRRAVQASRIEDGALSSSFGFGAKWQLRKAQGYLVLKNLEQNDVRAYCYYFKRVK